MIKHEEWRIIREGYFYEVSSLGRVRSLDRYKEGFVYTSSGDKSYYCSLKPGKLLKPQDNFGYSRVTINIENKFKKYNVHKLVAEAFNIIRLPYQDQINHKNGIKHDNRVENLEWCSQIENMGHAVTTGLHNPSNKHSRKEVRQYTLDGNLVAIYVSASECRRVTGLPITKQNLKRKNTKGGFIWELS